MVVKTIHLCGGYRFIGLYSWFQFSDARLQHARAGLGLWCSHYRTCNRSTGFGAWIGVCRIVSTGGSSNTGFGVVTLASLFPILAVLCYATFLFKGDDYYYATFSEADWHVQAGEYGKNYNADLQRFGDIVAKRRLASSSGASESDMALSLSAEQLAAVKASLQENGKLPSGYSLQTQISGNALDAVPLDKDDASSRSIVQPTNTNSIIVRDGVSTPDEVWDPGTEIMAAFTNNFDFFPNTFRPDEDSNGNGILDPGEDIYSIDEESGELVYNKPDKKYPDAKLEGPDQDRGSDRGSHMGNRSFVWNIINCSDCRS